MDLEVAAAGSAACSSDLVEQSMYFNGHLVAIQMAPTLLP